jgi:hypothetical protein
MTNVEDQHARHYFANASTRPSISVTTMVSRATANPPHAVGVAGKLSRHNTLPVLMLRCVSGLWELPVLAVDHRFAVLDRTIRAKNLLKEQIYLACREPIFRLDRVRRVANDDDLFIKEVT